MSALRALRPGRTSSGRRPGDVDHGDALFLVIPAMEALDARDVDVVRAEKRRHVDGRRFVGLPDFGGAFFFAVEGLDADDLPLLVVVEVRADLAAKPEHVRHRRW